MIARHTLSPDDCDLGCAVGCVRRGLALIQKRPNDRPHLTFRQLLIEEVLGSRGELVLKRWADARSGVEPIPWNDLVVAANSRTPDLADFIDVKTRSLPWHDLLVQDHQPEHFAYVLVFPTTYPTFCIRGWCWGHEAKRPQFWGDKANTGRPAYFVPQDSGVLREPDELLEHWRQRQRQRQPVPA
jgi:hypothetical protein